MALTKAQRQKLVDDLVTNEVFGEDSKDALMELTDNQLVALADGDQLDEMVNNQLGEEEGDLTDNQKKDKSKKNLENVETNELEAELKKRKGKKDKPTNNSDNQEVTTNEDGEVDEEVWLKKAPKSVRQMITNSKRIVNNEKEKHIKVITANSNNRFTEDQLREKDVEELEVLADLAGEPTNNSETEDEEEELRFLPRKGNYSARAAATTGVTTNREEEDDSPLVAPSLDFSDS